MGRSAGPPVRELPHVNISLHQTEEQLHRAILAFCNEAFDWGLDYEDVEVGGGCDQQLAGGIGKSAKTKARAALRAALRSLRRRCLDALCSARRCSSQTSL